MALFGYAVNSYYFYLIAFGLFLLTNSVQAQLHAGFIYGEITMVDDQKHTGVIQWSNHELSWDDIFTATKKENKVLHFLSSEEIKRLSEEEKAEKSDWGFMRLWENHYPSKNHVFECQFGYIRSITVTGEQSARVTLKNGKIVEVYGREDTGRKIYILDKEGRRRSKLEWDRIQTVEFKNTPENAFDPKVIPLYGKITTDFGELTGFIQWDMDESLNVHYLDGKREGKKKALQFSEITRIEKTGDNTCRITLLTGEKLEFSDTDDVGKSNHGLMIKNNLAGAIKVDWNDFQNITFSRNIPRATGYHEYKKTKPLSGKIRTTDQATLQGKFIFDLDESMSVELLKGKSHDLLYYIPFANIQSIERKNHKYASVILKNGNKLLLTGSNDVTDKNWGVLVLDGTNKPQYVPWNKVNSVTFTY